MDTFDAAGAKLLGGLFGELTSKACVVDAAAFDRARAHDRVEDFELFIKGCVFEADDKASEVVMVDFF